MLGAACTSKPAQTEYGACGAMRVVLNGYGYGYNGSSSELRVILIYIYILRLAVLVAVWRPADALCGTRSEARAAESWDRPEVGCARMIRLRSFGMREGVVRWRQARQKSGW